MWRATKEKAQETKEFYEKAYADEEIKFSIRPVPGNRGFNVEATRNCSQCGQEMTQGDGFDKKAVCEDCSRKVKMVNLKAADAAGEKSREALRFYDDFEEICQ